MARFSFRTVSARSVVVVMLGLRIVTAQVIASVVTTTHFLMASP